MDFRTRSVTSVSVDVMRRSYASFAIMARVANSKSENCDLAVAVPPGDECLGAGNSPPGQST